MGCDTHGRVRCSCHIPGSLTAHQHTRVCAHVLIHSVRVGTFSGVPQLVPETSGTGTPSGPGPGA